MMPKPRRKWPSLYWESPKELELLKRIVAVTGTDLRFEALEQSREGGLVFRVSGSRGEGLVLEARDTTQDSFFIHRHAFVYWDSDGKAAIELRTARWDAWLQGKVTGDHAHETLSSYKRRKVRDLKNRTEGFRRDRIRYWPSWKPAPTTLAGFSNEAVTELFARHLQRPKRTRRKKQPEIRNWVFGRPPEHLLKKDPKDFTKGEKKEFDQYVEAFADALYESITGGAQQSNHPNVHVAPQTPGFLAWKASSQASWAKQTLKELKNLGGLLRRSLMHSEGPKGAARAVQTVDEQVAIAKKAERKANRAWLKAHQIQAKASPDDYEAYKKNADLFHDAYDAAQAVSQAFKRAKSAATKAGFAREVARINIASD